MAKLVLQSPLAGWCTPLEEVPDPVFSARMAGEGLAIDPTAGLLHAPCDGEIVPMRAAKHAVTVRTSQGVEILIHVGIDTVALDGQGFEPLVKPGALVKTGEPLLRFDLDLIARRAPSLVSPILVAAGGAIVRRASPGALAVGDFLMEIECVAASPAGTGGASSELHGRFKVPFDHGLHARPAALLAAALRPLSADVSLVSRGRAANARSTVAMMTLGVHAGETIEIRARGHDAAQALAELAKLLAPADEPAASPGAAPRDPLPRRIPGVVACRGIALGVAAPLARPEAPVVEAGAGVARETTQLRQALASVRGHLESMVATARGEQQALLAAHVELIQDPDLAMRAEEQVAVGKSAGFAWRHAARATASALGDSDDARMRERAADLRDLEQQVLRVLAGEKPGAARELPERAILIADELLPSQLLALDPRRIAGICTARGGPTSHAAIIAASRGIPALVAAGGRVLEIAEGTALVLEAERGELEIDPDARRVGELEQALATRRTQEAADRAAASAPCATRDGVPVAVYANLGALAEVASAIDAGAEGCGLLRTEFLFLERREPPGEEEQAREYQAIADALAGRTLTIRTLDIGGDKAIAYLPLPREDNPALGLRGLRTSLWRPELLRTQLRAILRVRGDCRILLPMVTDLEDVRAVRALLEECRVALGRAQAPALGVMIETPASALLADQLVHEADFLSIGTNDLSQYTMAMDRTHPELAAKLDALHPAVLRLMAHASQAAQAAGREIAVCGGLGSDPEALPILVGLGIHEISAVPAAIPRLKRIIRTLDAKRCRDLAQRALELPDARAVRALVEEST